MSVLARIVERKRADVAARQRARPLADLEANARPSERDFRAALAAPGLSLIAEIKRRSPSRGDLRADFDPAAIARAYDRRASAISVLTDEPFFGGHLEHLTLARNASCIPLLAKDFVVDPHQVVEARAAGADSILLMASVLETAEIERCLSVARGLGMEPLVEVHDAQELDAVLGETTAAIVGVNSRDLKTLAIDEAVVHRLAPRARAAGKIVVAESGILDRAGVERLRGVADAVLIGTSLMLASDIGAKLEELGW